MKGIVIKYGLFANNKVMMAQKYLTRVGLFFYFMQE